LQECKNIRIVILYCFDSLTSSHVARDFILSELSIEFSAV
jgi:hypothetical protein